MAMAMAYSSFTRIPLQPHQYTLLTPTTPHRYRFRSQLRVRTTSSSSSSWKEYEDALQDKDLLRALHFLESLQSSSLSKDLELREENENISYDDEGATSMAAPLLLQPARNWEILDTCLYCQDMELVSRSYEFLHSRGFLPTFGKFRNIATKGPGNVTPTVLKELTGLEASNFTQKKWGLSGSSAPVLLASIAGISYLVNVGLDLRPKLAVILGLAFLDAVYLGGSGLAQVLSLWPRYKRRILVHEAGHLVTAYLLGCPVRGVILEPLQAMQMGVQGQAGTQFWDKTLESELYEGRLTSASFNRYSMVLFAGIAAEALVYGQAEGGESDENLFKAITSLLRPPWSVAQMSNQARWAVLQSYDLLKTHKNVLRAAVKALEKTTNLGFVIRKIEDAMTAGH